MRIPPKRSDEQCLAPSSSAFAECNQLNNPRLSLPYGAGQICGKCKKPSLESVFGSGLLWVVQHDSLEEYQLPLKITKGLILRKHIAFSFEGDYTPMKT